MGLKRFALLVENEIFDIIPFPDDSENEMSKRWSNGFANNPIGMDVTSFEDCYIGSIWTGAEFDNSNVLESAKFNTDKNINRYAMLENNKVFMLLYPTDSQIMKKEMYQAAFSTNTVTGIEITNMPSYIAFGWTWDGASFNPPEVLR